MNLLLPSFLFVLAWGITLFTRRSRDLGRIQRIIGCTASALALLWLTGLRVLTPDQLIGVTVPIIILFMHLVLTGIAYLVVPQRVLARPEAPLLLLVHALLLIAFVTQDVLSLLTSLTLTATALGYLEWKESSRHRTNPARQERLNVYLAYRSISLIGLVILFLVIASTENVLPSTQDLSQLQLPTWAQWIIAISLTSSLGLFPFHTWVISFLSATRLNLFISLFVIEVSGIVLVRFFAPLSLHLGTPSPYLLGCAVVSLLYFALLLFGEASLRRIVAYLLLSHISLMVITLLITKGNDHESIFLDLANVGISGTGLLTCLSILASRFGDESVVIPSGLAKAFPELAICFLACSLSLVGFPGTIGFMSEELLLKSSAGYQAMLIPIILIAIALNGYSCFRLFARVVYGGAPNSSNNQLDLSLREKLAIRAIILLLIINGVIPYTILALSDV